MYLLKTRPYFFCLCDAILTEENVHANDATALVFANKFS